jgi:lysyl-tRNA synthetase class 1
MENEQKDIKNMHWSEVIASKIVSERKPPYIVMSGITPSGPVHPGTLCEFLFAYAISKQLSKYGGAKLVFVSDNMDALDSVPAPLKEYEETIKQDMGMPLALARDPAGCHKSFADHFIDETQRIMKLFQVELEFVRAGEFYAKGLYDQYAKELCDRKEEVKEVVRVSSLREEMPADWSPLMPLCDKCKNIDKNIVLEYSNGIYKYKCSKCGFVGENKIEDHKYKLLFRLDWPTRHKFMNVAVEGGSVDHHTKGGTFSTVTAVRKEIYGDQNPYLYKFGFLKYKGKKYSKSKGIGHTVNELLELAPIELIKYILLRPDIQEDRELVIDSDTLFPILDDFKKAGEIQQDNEDSAMHRADNKKKMAYELCEVKRRWIAEPADMILYYNIYENWDTVAKMCGDPEGVSVLGQYIERWIKRGLIPERYTFKVQLKPITNDVVREYVSAAKEGMSAEELHNLVFEVAKNKGIENKEVFKQVYLWLIGKEMGPRLGKLIYAVGVGKIKSML